MAQAQPDKVVRIGSSSGFWGDSQVAAAQLVHRGEMDYLVGDYLAELTMSIMARAREADPNMGYATDFVTVTMRRLIKDLARKNIKVVSNAGGVNPRACAEAIRKIVRDAGLSLKVAYVHGDDLLPQVEQFRAEGLKEMFTGAALPPKLLSMNAYLGGIPIAEALKAGADIVVTGRCVDSALALGILMYEHGWSPTDYDKLAAGSLVGHIIECGAQCTGGLFTDWRDVPDWDDIGYPIVECHADGSFIVSKPPSTGGLVSFGSVAEQLLYEIGDPGAYILPDVVCDFTQVTMQEVGENRVRVAGAKGLPPTGMYKVSATFPDGWRAVAQITIGGPEAVHKARRTGEALLKRTRRMLAAMNQADFRDSLVEAIGGENMYGPHSRALEAREAQMRLAVSHDERMPVEMFLRECSSPGCSMAQGTTGSGGARPKASPIVRLFSCLVPKTRVKAAIDLEGQAIPVSIPTEGGFKQGAKAPAGSSDVPAGPTVTVPLIRLAWGRSGDKGNASNIGIIARKPEYLPAIRRALTPETVGAYMAHLVKGKVERFEVPGIRALNFLMQDALGGGGMASLRNDPLGKAHAQILLDMPVEVPKAWGLS
ncbi:acyclic terpene utilization AtuA family protein [Desertibaculum subflavum]|uniref:acyclic terpene utilization AtuA family protein n=1 Tax=Desertibaculum subflavum TaxID=2268458 RepID=UPI000E667E4D